jgi:hypothetical protein
MADSFWRARVLESKTPEEALATLENDAGLSPARAIFAMRRYSPTLFVKWRTQKPAEPKYGGNARMQHFSFRDVHA